MILSVDPGIRGCGCAMFDDDKKLFKAAYVKNLIVEGSGPRECTTMARAVHEWAGTGMFKLVVEWPQTYHGRSSRGDANDLFPLAGIGAALAMTRMPWELKHYRPQEWKGNVNADVMIRRIQSKLWPEEMKSVVLPKAKSLHHNVWDAVGIGLKYVGRLGK